MSRLVASSVVLFALAGVAAACPFCGVVQPTLAQRRDDAVFVALAEVADVAGKIGGRRFLIHKVFKAPPGLGERKALELPIDLPGAKERGGLKSGKLVILFAEGDAREPATDWGWTIEPVDETRVDYFARAPELQ